MYHVQDHEDDKHGLDFGNDRGLIGMGTFFFWSNVLW